MPAPFVPERQRFRRRIRRRSRPIADLPDSPDGWAFFLDIDGTLIDIAPTPDAVVVPPGLPETLAALVEKTDGALALITGRDIATVDRLFAPARLPVGAVHGTELRFGSGEVRAAPPIPALDRIRLILAAFAAATPGALFEDKGVAVALHYRADPSLHDRIEAAVHDAATLAGDAVTIQPGKMVFEIRPASADKGVALAAFMAEPSFRGRLPLAVGDDVTDESMFSAAVRLGGNALPVGTGPGRPPAFPDPDAVRAWLSRLAKA
ncbi:MAG: trehalose-phosphatase [Rhodospirillaceae bacterium]|nr:trehalose-phosphatase [Rhodospirillaceae bacterium]